MEIVGQLTGGVAHDFNNVLTVISGTIDLLAEAVADRLDLAAITTLISEAAARGASLTSNLPAFSCGQPSQPRNVDLASMLADAERLLRPTLGELIDISSEPVTGVHLVLADRSRLMAAMLNLAILAREAMPGGGKLGFKAGRADLEISAEDLSWSWSAPPATASPGTRSRRSPISASSRISSGNPEVRSEAGRGSSVRMYLPRANAVARSPDEIDSERGDEAVLIVEDDTLVREYLRLCRQRAGATRAPRGRRAVARQAVPQGRVGESDWRRTCGLTPRSSPGDATE